MTARTHLRSRRWIATAAVALLPLSAACGSEGDDTERAASREAARTAVVIDLVAFDPEALSVAVGEKVTWRHQDSGAHTVTSGTVQQGAAGVTQQPDDRFDSGEISDGETFEFAFDEAGTFPYFCRLHPATMRGEIHVR